MGSPPWSCGAGKEGRGAVWLAVIQPEKGIIGSPPWSWGGRATCSALRRPSPNHYLPIEMPPVLRRSAP